VQTLFTLNSARGDVEMNSFRVVAIPTETANEVRETKKAPGYGFPAYTELSNDQSPCRHCLRLTEPGVDQRILFTYDCFDGVEALPLPGPVYVHADDCTRYDESAGFPEQIRSRKITFNAYAEGRRLLNQRYVDDGNVDGAIDELFANPEVRYLHVRSTPAGCYTFRIERG
jgi:hypothetical protein